MDAVSVNTFQSVSVQTALVLSLYLANIARDPHRGLIMIDKEDSVGKLNADLLIYTKLFRQLSCVCL